MSQKKEPDYEKLSKELYSTLKELRNFIDSRHEGHHALETMVKADSLIQRWKDLAKPEGSLFRVGFTSEIVVFAKNYEDAEKVASKFISGEKHSWKQSLKIESFIDLGEYANVLPWCEEGMNEDELTCAQILKLCGE